MADEVTTGELARAISRLESAVNGLRQEVLTIAVWKAEREHIEHRLNETARQAADARAKAISEAGKVAATMEADRDRQQSFRRAMIVAVVSVGLVYVGQLAWQLISVAAGAS